MPIYFLMPLLNGAGLFAVLYPRHLNPSFPGSFRYGFLIGLVLSLGAILPHAKQGGETRYETLRKLMVSGSALAFLIGACQAATW